MQSNDTNTRTPAHNENLPSSIPEDDFAANWSEDLFTPALTTDQVIKANTNLQNDAVNLRIMLLTLTRTPIELLELGREDLTAFEEMFAAVNNYIEFAEYSLDAAKSAQARLMATTGKLLVELDA